VDKLAHQPLYKEHTINDDLSQGIYPDVVTDFDLAAAEEAMNQAITNYGNLAYLLGQQRGEAIVPQFKTYYVWQHFDGMMRLEVQAESAEQALAMAIHPSNSKRWVIDESTIMSTDHPMEVEETE
jgi:hypothetical protein